jgi:hypothetical protein
VGESEIFDELLIGRCLLEWIEVLAMEVFYQCLLHAEDVAHRADKCRDGLKPGSTGGPPAALTGDELIAVLSQGSDQDRLE